MNPYAALKLRISDNLGRDQWTRMAMMAGVPNGTASYFKSALDLLTWMEGSRGSDGQVMLSEGNYETLRMLCNTCSAANVAVMLPKAVKTKQQLDVEWAMLCQAIVDETPSSILESLKVAFNQRGSNDMGTWFQTMNNRAIFTGPDRLKNLQTIYNLFSGYGWYSYLDRLKQHIADVQASAPTPAAAIPASGGFHVLGPMPAAAPLPPMPPAADDEVVRVVRKEEMVQYHIASLKTGKPELVKTAEPLTDKNLALDYLEATLGMKKYQGTLCGYYTKANEANAKAKRFNLVEHAEEIDDEEVVIKKKPEIRISEEALARQKKATIDTFEIDGETRSVATGGTLPLFLFVIRRADRSYVCANVEEIIKNYARAKELLVRLQKSCKPGEDAAIYLLGKANEEEEDNLEVSDDTVVRIAGSAGSKKGK